MDKIGRIRFKNLLSSMLNFFEKSEDENENEKAILFRIGVIILNKLRIHASVDPSLGQDVRELNKKILNTPKESLVDALWVDVEDLLFAYLEDLTGA